MSGNKDNKDPLEQFFKKKTAEYDISYREEDWLRLESKLDLQDAQISYQRKVRWIAVAAVLTVSLLGYFTFDNYKRLNEINQALSDGITLSGEPGPSITENHSDDGAFQSDMDEQVPSSQEQEPSPLKRDVQDREVTEPHTADTSPAVPEDTEERRVHAASDMPGRMLPEFETRDEKTAGSVLEHQAVPVFAMKSTLPKRSGYLEQKIAQTKPEHAFMADFHGESERDVVTPPIQSRFTIGLVTAPDLSSVSNFSGFYDPGYKVGVTVDYRLTSRLSVSTGFVPSMVRYSAENREYNLSGYYNGFEGPASMVGECLLFDIPVSLAYKLLDFENSAMFVSAGLSSYIMINEDYVFSYESDSGDGTDSWSDRTGTRHWFSNAGFSIGFEREITRNISLRAEPYFRIPVREVGWVNVRLFSMGSFFSIRYRL